MHISQPLFSEENFTFKLLSVAHWMGHKVHDWVRPAPYVSGFACCSSQRAEFEAHVKDSRYVRFKITRREREEREIEKESNNEDEAIHTVPYIETMPIYLDLMFHQPKCRVATTESTVRDCRRWSIRGRNLFKTRKTWYTALDIGQNTFPATRGRYPCAQPSVAMCGAHRHAKTRRSLQTGCE